MNIEKKIILNAFFNEQFSYCSLTWMLRSRKINIKMNRINKKCLRIVYNDNDNISSWKTQILATEMHIIVTGFSPDIMKNVFPLNKSISYNARNIRTFRPRS